MSGKPPRKAPVLAVLNMKGGVGKTTISAHVFREFFEAHRAATLLIDLDPQFNLTQALFTRTDYDKIKKSKNTIYSVMEPVISKSLFDIKISNKPIPRSEKVTTSLFYFKNTNPKKELRILPGDFSISKYSLMDDQKKLNFVRERLKTFINNARIDFDVVCIDCNPSSSFLTVCALHCCTHILVPVRPDRYSILGLELLSEFVESIPTISPKPEIMVVLNGIPRQSYNDTVETELRNHPVFGPMTLANRIYHSKLLLAHPDYTGFATDKKVPYRESLKKELTKVAGEIYSRLGIKP